MGDSITNHDEDAPPQATVNGLLQNFLATAHKVMLLLTRNFATVNGRLDRKIPWKRRNSLGMMPRSPVAEYLKMNAARPLPTVESRLMAQLRRVEKRLAELEAERSALQRLIVEFRKEDPQKREVGRRKSIKKAVMEERILEMLRANSRPMSSGLIQQRLLSAGHEINPNTLRSHIRRLAERGIIEKSTIEFPGWRLSERR